MDRPGGRRVHCYIPDRRGAGNKQALLAALNLCAWTAPQPHTTCTTTDVELLLAHLKGQDSSLDTAISSDVERALVVSSDPLLTVTPNFAQTPDRRCSSAVRLERFESVANDGDDPHPTRWSGEPMSVNPFDDDNGAFSSWSTTRSSTACGRPSPMFQPAGGWFTAKRTALRAWTTSNRTGPIYGRGVCASGWRSAGLITKPAGLGAVG